MDVGETQVGPLKEGETYNKADIHAIAKKNRLLGWFARFVAHRCGIWTADEYIAVGRKLVNARGIRRLYLQTLEKKICHLRGLEIADFSHVGEGLRLPHGKNVTVNPNAVIGKQCILYHGVTIGRAQGKGVPVLEDRVCCCPNATIVGNITVGHDSLIAAGAFVDFDVPPHSVVIGNPGIIHHKEFASRDEIY